MTIPEARRRTRLPATVIALGITSFFTDIASEAVFPRGKAASSLVRSDEGSQEWTLVAWGEAGRESV